jgi:hypothetical protein
MVFGLGVGALGLHHYTSSPDQFRRSNRFNTRLIVIGVLVLAAVRLADALTGQGWDSATVPPYMFHSAISYYALAMLTLPVLVWLLNRGTDRLRAALIAVAVCMVVHQILVVTVRPLMTLGWVELAKLLLTAKYGYFHMTSFVMLGVMMGIVLRRNHAAPRFLTDLMVYGAVLMAIGLVMIHLVKGEPFLWDFNNAHPWHLCLYAGVTLWIIAGFCRINRSVDALKARPIQVLNGFFIASGILALPIFVGHEIVIPAKDVLVNLGVHGALALLIPLGLFLGALGWGYRNLMRFVIR